MSDTLVNLPQSQMADVAIDATGRDSVRVEGDVNQSQGIPFEQVKDILIGWLNKEPQERRLAQASTDRRLDRVAGILGWLAGAMVLQVLVTAVLLFVTLQLLLALVGPRLMAGL